MHAEPQLTFLPDAAVPARGRMALYTLGGPGEAVPVEAAARLGLDGARATATLYRPDGDRPVRDEIAVVAVPLERALPALLDLREPRGLEHGGRERPSDSVRVWALAFRVAWRLVVEQRVVPSMTIGGDGAAAGVWRAHPGGDPASLDTLARLAAAMPPAAHAVPSPADAERVWRPEDLLAAALDALADLAARRGNADPREGRPRARLLPWTARWEEGLRDSADPSVPLREGAADLAAGIAGWHAAVDTDAGGLTEVRLVAPPDPDGAWRLELGVRTETGALLPAEQVWAGDPEGDSAVAARQEALLAGLGRCARLFAPMEEALSEAVPEAVPLSVEEAWTFLSEVAPLLDGAGVVVRLPEDLAADDLRIRLRVGAATGDGGDTDDGGDRGEVPFSWEVALGEDTLSDDEVSRLLASPDPLVFWRGRWVRIDPADAERLRSLGAPGTVGFAEGLGLALAGTQPAGWDGPTGTTTEADVVADGAVAELLERLRSAADVPPAAQRPEGFEGELRPYQQRGVGWLAGMGALGLGAVLADDMGLGKTIQLIGYLLARGGDGPHLVVCPTSVVGNWEREIGRFAPGLEVTRHHGPDRPTELPPAPRGVWLTTYGTLRRDADLLAGVTWDVLTLDEAQHVKNPTTAGARAVRRLEAAHAVAMTGTPLENRLAELWSLMDVCNPGLLGTRAAFGRRFVTPIEKRRDPATALRLRRFVAPFVLRREKTDPAVIDDLPEKIERTVVCPLTPEQAELYEEATAAVLEGGLAEASDMERRGRVLALLTRLKQICNHPAQANDEPESAELEGRSGKLATCRDLVANAVDGGEQVLIFTQYVAMGRRLARQLSADLDVDVPLLHGGVNAGARDRMVAAFQGEGNAPASPVLVVSLRAGGTGLNLTAATQVVHYDRWWNPAVEDQATDRAHRIGQRRTVEVHKLITAGTVEERVADLLEQKRSLASSVVGAGEAWITELGDDELAELVALGVDAQITELDEEHWGESAFEEAS